MRTVVDGNGHTLAFGYDRLGRQVSRSRQVGGRAEEWFTAYDAFDRVVTQTDAGGARIYRIWCDPTFAPYLETELTRIIRGEPNERH